jgi:hypothetical protein
MEKRYQVFISSTFADLKEERGKVQQAVMELDCIPAGMELFPAIDEEQFEFIKKVIDDCDYYLLIIGGRYGSLSDEGVSYTEMEYKYAVSKGIKVIAFLHKDPNSLPVSKSETDTAAREKLVAFRNEVATGRLVKFWTEANELPGLTLSSLTRTIRTYPAVGWIRGNSVADPSVYKEISDLRKENQELKDALTANVSNIAVFNDIAGMDEVITVRGIGRSLESENDEEWELDISWKRLFSIISPQLTTASFDYEDTISRIIAGRIASEAGNALQGKYLLQETDQLLRIQFKALGLIQVTNSDGRFYWALTEEGEKEMMNSLVVRKAKPNSAL